MIPQAAESQSAEAEPKPLELHTQYVQGLYRICNGDLTDYNEYIRFLRTGRSYLNLFITRGIETIEDSFGSKHQESGIFINQANQWIAIPENISLGTIYDPHPSFYRIYNIQPGQQVREMKTGNKWRNINELVNTPNLPLLELELLYLFERANRIYPSVTKKNAFEVMAEELGDSLTFWKSTGPQDRLLVQTDFANYMSNFFLELSGSDNLNEVELIRSLGYRAKQSDLDNVNKKVEQKQKGYTSEKKETIGLQIISSLPNINGRTRYQILNASRRESRLPVDLQLLRDELERRQMSTDQVDFAINGEISQALEGFQEIMLLHNDKYKIPDKIKSRFPLARSNPSELIRYAENWYKLSILVFIKEFENLYGKKPHIGFTNI